MREKILILFFLILGNVVFSQNVTFNIGLQGKIWYLSDQSNVNELLLRNSLQIKKNNNKGLMVGFITDLNISKIQNSNVAFNVGYQFSPIAWISFSKCFYFNLLNDNNFTGYGFDINVLIPFDIDKNQTGILITYGYGSNSTGDHLLLNIGYNHDF